MVLVVCPLIWVAVNNVNEGRVLGVDPSLSLSVFKRIHKLKMSTGQIIPR